MKTPWLPVCIVTICLIVSLSLSAVSASSSSLIIGDLDRNGTVNSADVRALLLYMVGNGSLTAEQRLQVDVDDNARIDSSDARAVLAMIVWDKKPVTISTTTTTIVTTTTTAPSLDDDGYYDDVIKP